MPAAENRASQQACAATSASEWPSSPRSPGPVQAGDPELAVRPLRRERVDVDADARPRQGERPGHEALRERSSASASRRSSGRVTLKASSRAGHDVDVDARAARPGRRRRWPARSPRSRARARARRGGSPAGSGRPRTRARSTGPSSRCRRVSAGGTAGTTACSPARSAATTAANTCGGTNARAASCTSTRSPGGSAARPAATDACRVSPPGHDHGTRRERAHLVQGVGRGDHDDVGPGPRRPAPSRAQTSSGRPRDLHQRLRPAGAQPLAATGRDDDEPDPRDGNRAHRAVCVRRRGGTVRTRGPRRGWPRPCPPRSSRPARARRPGSDGPWRACASRRPTGRGPGRGATGRGRPRPP